MGYIDINRGDRSFNELFSTFSQWFFLHPLLEKNIFPEKSPELKKDPKIRFKISGQFFQKIDFSNIYGYMKKIIITENQLKKLSMIIQDKNKPVKTNKLNMINLVQNHEKIK